ncbi:OpgC domain-containing protein [Nocardioides sp. MAHUQ-72]|uniref:OpgC domain-containing protein n=1 Tax=unclassified Nocardioides TaxID=2615069 RepID=UPI0036091A9D
MGSSPAAVADGDPSPDPVPSPAAGHPWFGPGLDLPDDDPRAYADRLGLQPSLYSVPVDYPLGDDDEDALRSSVTSVATQGAVAVVDLEPQVALDDLDGADADRLADVLADLHRELDTFFLVRFAPEMNGSWVTWGQQPRSYVPAFRLVADAVHAATDQAAMVWAPAYGSGYPFGKAYGAVDPSGTREEDELDTNGDARVDERDDPYGPYYPGDEATDWVGLTLYRFGGVDANTVPEPEEYAQRLDERWGYGDRTRRTSFYDRFAESAGKPVLVETGALYNAAVGGADELDVKRAWWRQVLAANESHPLIGALSWLEVARVEAETDGKLADWRATHTGRLAGAFRSDVSASGVDTGPVTRQITQATANEATAQGRLPDAEHLGDSMGWVVLCVVLLAVLFLVSGATGRLAPSWSYADDGSASRDLRIDLFRGFLICTVVITHTELAGPYSYLTLNAFGAVSGAEGFVMLSGVVLGMVQASQVKRLGEWPAAVLRLRRARKIYLVALVVTVLVFVLGQLPGLDATVVTTFTDRGTGAAGGAAAGQVYDLYANARHLFDYPPPWFAVRELLTLHMGPWVLNVLGLFVVLTALVPLLSWLLVRGLWWVVLAVSWGAYVYGTVGDVHWLPSQFEDVFPLLIWQVAFVHGLVLGYYRRQVVTALTTRAGKVVCALLVTAYAAVLGWLWLAHRGVLPLGPFDPGTYAGLYDRFYIRVDLQPGRLVDLALVAVVAFAFLTAFWRPVHGAVGGFLVPLGQASLYVFIVHVFLVIAVDNVPGLDRDSTWQGLVLHTCELAVVWVLVRKKVLFSVIPR